MSKKKKVRVAFKKNRQKRTCANDLTRSYHANDPAAAVPTAGERVRAKGDLSRHRTIMTETTTAEGAPSDPAADPASLRVVDLEQCLAGRVVMIHGLSSIVEDDAGAHHSCHVRRLLKTMSIDARNVVTVGDRVWFRPGGAGGDEGLIEKVEPRGGAIVRGYRRHKHVLVANVDQLLIVSALEEPGLKLPLIDRYLISAEIGGVRPVIVLNKVDLVDPALYQWVVGLYTMLGYETIFASAADGRGIDRLRDVGGDWNDGVFGTIGRRQKLALERDSTGLESARPRGVGLDLQRKAYDDDGGTDPSGSGRLRRRYARPASVRIMGRGAFGVVGSVPGVSAVFGTLQVSGLLAHA